MDSNVATMDGKDSAIQVVDELNQTFPIPKLAALGLQHVLALYAGAVLIPILVGSAIGLSKEQISMLVSADLFACGIATFIQVVGLGKYIGIRLPVVLGCSFTTLAPMIMVAKTYGIDYMFGSIIGSGVVIFVASLFMERILHLFPRVVTGTFVTVIGLSLAPIAVTDLAGGHGSPTFGSLTNLLLGVFVIAVIVLVNKLFSGFTKAISVLIGIVVGSIAAGFLGMLDFAQVANADIVHVVTPFAFGVPKFSIAAIAILSLFSIINMIESVGMFEFIGDLCGKKVTKRDITNGIRAEGVAQVIGGVFNSFPYVTFSENAGVMSLTGVKSRIVLIAASVILVALSVFPKFAAITTLVPSPVLGGAMVAIFGMITVAGIRMLSTVDLENHNNLLIIAVSMGLGLGFGSVQGMFASFPEMARLLLSNAIFVASVTAVVLNLILNSHLIRQDREETA